MCGCLPLDSLRRQFWSWPRICAFRKRMKAYNELYKREQKVKWLPKLSRDEAVVLREMEDRFDMREVLTFRLLAARQLEVEAESHKLKMPPILSEKQKLHGKKLFGAFRKFGEKVRVSFLFLCGLFD